MSYISFSTRCQDGGIVHKKSTSVSGVAEGFAKGVTGGGSATAVYPSTNAELVSYLKDSPPRLSKTFDFTNTEGTASGPGCAPWGTGSGCQLAINKDNWCTNYQSSAPSASVSYDNAGMLGTTVASDKTIIGEGSSGVIKGKGLRIVSGASNVIIQNIAITDINPKYVWGGDAITINNADMVWIDHVTLHATGTTTGHLPRRSSDLVTMKGNYIYHTSGRSPKVQGNTLLDAVNNYWYDSSGHSFEIGSGGYVLAEGNVFQNIPMVVESPIEGQIFSSPNTSANQVCSTYLGRVCQVNGSGSSGTFSQADTAFLTNFSGKNIASASAYSVAQSSVPSNAGQGKL